MNELTAEIDVATKLTGQRKVPPLVEADVSAQSYTRVSFDLWKNVVHVVIADESVKKATHDIYGLHTNDAARDLGRMENLDIADVLKDATEITGEDWGAMTTPPNSDYNPFNSDKGIPAAIKAISQGGYSPTHVAMHSDVWADFISNSYVQKYVDAGLLRVPEGQAGVLSLPMYPSLRIMIDDALLNTACYVVAQDAPAVVFGEGPTESAKYRNEAAGYSAFILRSWLQPKLVLSAAARELTGVHA